MEKLPDVEINKKLMLVQSELKAPKNHYSSFGEYHYRSAEDILEALKPILKKHECTVRLSDEIKEIGSYTYIESKCFFSDGKVILTTRSQAGITPEKKKIDISQLFGVASSYARKYALNGMFLIDDTKDADTDEHRKQTNSPSESTPQSTRRTSITPSDGKKWLNPNTKDWDNAVSKKKSIEEVKKFYSISKTNETKYINEISK